VIDGEMVGPNGLDEARVAFVAHQRLVALIELALKARDNGHASLGILCNLNSAAFDCCLVDGELGVAFLAGNDGRHYGSVVIDLVVAHLVDRLRTTPVLMIAVVLMVLNVGQRLNHTIPPPPIGGGSARSAILTRRGRGWGHRSRCVTSSPAATQHKSKNWVA
jgi:hypothetical protein